MAQNIYDNPAFFEGYAQLPRSVQGLNGAPEWPALKAMLPDLTGKAVVDLGCGYGWFCRAARELGASDVTGVDISEKMLARAAELTDDNRIHYQRSDLESLALKANSLDLDLQLAGATLPAGAGHAIRQGSARAKTRWQPGLLDGAPDLYLRHPSGLAHRRQR